MTRSRNDNSYFSDIAVHHLSLILQLESLGHPDVLGSFEDHLLESCPLGRKAEGRELCLPPALGVFNHRDEGFALLPFLAGRGGTRSKRRL